MASPGLHTRLAVRRPDRDGRSRATFRNVSPAPSNSSLRKIAPLVGLSISFKDRVLSPSVKYYNPRWTSLFMYLIDHINVVAHCEMITMMTGQVLTARDSSRDYGSIPIHFDLRESKEVSLRC